MQSYTNNVQDRQGNAIAGAQVLVLKDGATAVIYSDNGITPATNPLTTDANGSFTFYGPTGNYSLTITSPRLPGPVEYVGIPILDPDDFDFTLRDDLASEASAKGSELVAYIPSGTGAVATTVQAKLREIVSPEDFGAIGDGVADDTVPLQTFFDAVFNSAVTGLQGRSAGKSYRTTATVVLTGNRGSVDFGGSRILPDSSVLVAVQCGTVPVTLGNVAVTGVLVERAALDTGTENIGFLYVRMNDSVFTSCESRSSKYNHVFRPETGTSTSYCEFVNLGGVFGVYNIWFDQQGTGFANENVFLGGRMVTSGSTINNVHMPTAAAANFNRFYGMCLEGAGVHAVYCNSVRNLFDCCRFEGTWSGEAVLLGPNSLHNKVVNITGLEIVRNEGLGNVIESWDFAVRQQNNAAKMVQKFQRTNTNTVAALSARTANTTANSKAITVSDASGISVGDFLSISGAIDTARVEGISGLNITLDTPAGATVAGAGLTRVAPPVLDLADDNLSANDAYLLRLFMNDFGASNFFVKALSRNGTLRHSINGDGLGFFSGGVQAGASGTPLLKHLHANATLTFTSINPGTIQEQSITVTGAATTDTAFASPRTSPGAEFIWSARVIGANTVVVRVANISSGAATPAAVVWSVDVNGH